MNPWPPAVAALRRGMTIVLPALAVNLALGGAPAQAQSDWTRCAEENALCRINGEALVRFGSAGRYAFRVSRDSVACNNDTFGDPAPGQRKQCDVSYQWRSDNLYRGWRDRGRPGDGQDARWRYCASEGGVCQVSGSSQVRFGANGRYETRSVSGRIACSTSTFGDPIPNVRKHCEAYEADEWTWCADERERCRLPGAGTVRYGADGRYAVREARDSIGCDNSVFGDPVPGRAKQCEYRAAHGGGIGGGIGGGGGGGGGWSGLTWDHCAREGDLCRLNGSAMVRYGGIGSTGSNGSYRYLEVRGGVACTNDLFGGDPAPGQSKQCEVLRMNR